MPHKGDEGNEWHEEGREDDDNEGKKKRARGLTTWGTLREE